MTWREIAGGSYHSLAMRNEFVGLGWGWGLNNWTQIGNNGSNANAPTNYTYPNNVTFIDKMAAGESHSLFIADGQLLVRGRNTEGQLGIANNTQQTSWVVAGNTNNKWSVIAAGQNMSAGINRNGELFTWGQNTFGQLGIGSLTNANSPQAIGCPVSSILSTSNFDENKIQIQVYPNPFTDNITLQLPLGVTKASVRIMNIEGKVVHTAQLTRNQDSISNLQTLAKGLYLMQLSLDNGEVATYKIVK
jgi:alpha-tubulin suppressor-like RCC1 family protein